MENRRFFLIAIFGVLLFLTYQAWQKDHPKTPVVTAPAAAVASDDPVVAASPATVAATGTDAGTSARPITAESERSPTSCVWKFLWPAATCGGWSSSGIRCPRPSPMSISP